MYPKLKPARPPPPDPQRLQQLKYEMRIKTLEANQRILIEVGKLRRILKEIYEKKDVKVIFSNVYYRLNQMPNNFKICSARPLKFSRFLFWINQSFRKFAQMVPKEYCIISKCELSNIPELKATLNILDQRNS